MEYYKNFIDDIHLLKDQIFFGKLDYDQELENFTCNNEIIINNRGIFNDIVIFKKNEKNDLEVINIKERNTKPITGILYLDSKVKYGSIKDKQLYLFKPTHKKYSNFYIPYKSSNNQNQKIYVNIIFKKWNIENKFPIGTLTDIIGNIGNIEAEYEHLRNYYEIKNNIWKIDNNQLKNDKILLESIQDKTPDFEVFSIDPIGSKDIDDAFHFYDNDTQYEVGIHIANPFIFFKEKINTVLERVSTVYQPHRKYNLLPNIYSDELISLIENKNRFALSLILTYDKSNNLINYDLKQTVVKNIKNYDYDTFDKIYMNNNNYSEFIDFSSKFFDDSLDSHKLVEKWMIYTNKKIAELIINNEDLNSYLVIRKHESSIIHNYGVINEELNTFLKLKQENSAYYEFYDKNNEQTHSKIGNSYYTHFTSPIRRAIDFYIHSLIINENENKNKNKIKNIINKLDLDTINKFTKNCRKMDRQSRRLKFLSEIKILESNIETDSYIIEIKSNKLTVFIPKFNLEEKIIIIPKKIEKIVEIINLTESEISFKKEDTIYNYRLYEKLRIKLYVFMSFENIFDKLKIEII